ncbi:MAG: hypothetical protein COV95_02560 [Candidatus Zambryskibacteria bacterium CG11_big_fil_rev_8_21_14_0_20_40_24]|uniref:Methyltransferase type 11 domain-containing protein n=1 Tax=Candidatus Zambryskibacteria bacterium CG11_big_fil_rev_8_21_14_0_20_40_24 TaxID=1975116 RepID=A0A2H0K818_9BACT|nr:MAG: hypothetical protein COV95_02560 [Candidatus Zambryskibacteria bacterium CG11_big_fil_rev_8_21_14_0_20_40_24]
MKRGFGTNFHKVYKENADLYHIFSVSEVFSKELKDRIKSKLTGGILLDIACGTCHKTNFYSKYFDKVFALDFSKPLLEYARKKYVDNDKINYIWSSAAKIPLLDESVDNILITWGSFPPSKTIREMQRVLKSGGGIVRIGAFKKDDFTTLFPDYSQKRINSINNIFRKFGFTIEPQIVDINFKNNTEAKKILSRITGAKAIKINKFKFEHTVALCYYTK